MKILSFFLIFFLFISFVNSQALPVRKDSSALEIECLFPLETENIWRYDIYLENKKVGILQMEVLKDHPEESKRRKFPKDFFSDFPDGVRYFVRIIDNYQKRTVMKQVLKDYRGFLYLVDESIDKLYPFLKDSLREGDQVGNSVVTSSGLKTFQGRSLSTVVLKDLDKDIVEEYMSQTGLYYYKNGAMEYKLTAAMVKFCGLGR
ncbi:hypothetical protein JWG44_01920 [Leptospira sp. 201903071]|uniref:hypothetical protein n=1 Tax=Leptospira ainazelensis TaxID=2810034 RepID=UPI0019640D27|nr:hypothetical protein [Leptospira ainazelensis]MBM9499009.1 hypothetical protein [Leptospira ainazelensis]